MTSIQLETKLDSLKELLRNEATFNQKILNERLRIARDFHQTKQFFSYQFFRHAINDLIQKLAEGWQYHDDTYSVVPQGSSGVGIHLTKPKAIYEAELAEVVAKEEATYLSEIEEAKSRLIPEIARVQVALKAAQAQLVKESREEEKLAKEIALVVAELNSQASSDEVTKSSEEVVLEDDHTQSELEAVE